MHNMFCGLMTFFFICGNFKLLHCRWQCTRMRVSGTQAVAAAPLPGVSSSAPDFLGRITPPAAGLWPWTGLKMWLSQVSLSPTLSGSHHRSAPPAAYPSLCTSCWVLETHTMTTPSPNVLPTRSMVLSSRCNHLSKSHPNSYSSCLSWWVLSEAVTAL